MFHFNDTLFHQKTGNSTKSNDDDDDVDCSKSGGDEDIDNLICEGNAGWFKEKVLKEVRDHFKL